MPYTLVEHPLAQEDIAALRKRGLGKVVQRAQERIAAYAELDLAKPDQHPNVTALPHHAPGWYRYKMGRVRIFFRLIASQIQIIQLDVLQVTMIDAHRDEDTYQDLAKRYKKIEVSE